MNNMQVQRLSGLWYSAEYSTFSISDEASEYQLTVAGYSGDAGDAMAAAIDADWIANGRKFTTVDNDNDVRPNENCAVLFGGGWWFGCLVVRMQSSLWVAGCSDAMIFGGGWWLQCNDLWGGWWFGCNHHWWRLVWFGCNRIWGGWLFKCNHLWRRLVGGVQPSFEEAGVSDAIVFEGGWWVGCNDPCGLPVVRMQ